MAPFNFLGNVIWLVCGGLISAIMYCAGGIMLILTIVGIPFGIQCFKIAGLMLAPFGREVVSSSRNSGCLSTIFNIIWIFSWGLCIAVTHLVFGVLLYITIVGIPFGRQHFKMVEITMMPFGKRLV